MNHESGARWRKWDLHIHAPGTALNDQFEGTNTAEKWEKYISCLEALPNEFFVLGITDYFSIRSFQQVMKLKSAGRLPKIELVIPNVELRIVPVTDTNTPINLHLLFSPELEIIECLNERFFSSLKFEFNNQQYKCTREDLIRLGRDFRNDTSLDEESAYRVGVEQYKTTIDDLKEIFRANKKLRDNVLIGVSNSSRDGNSGIQHSSMAATRREIYRFVDFIFSGRDTDRKYFLGLGTDSSQEIIRKYDSLKPCIHGSDAHSCNDVGKPDLNRFTWIKADPTFNGLLQILNEPADRIYIGEKPEKLIQVANHPTKYISQIEIVRKANSSLSETWFNNSLELNPGLVAIIGNKGSGKSALSDTIGLLGDTRQEAEFSFLNRDKFRDPKNNKAKEFIASLTWLDGRRSPAKSLDEPLDPTSLETVKYIPQNFFETVCNEIEGKAGRFEQELRRVIFSHVSVADRYGKTTLDELLSFRTSESEDRLKILKSDLHAINEEIANLEDKNAPAHKSKLEKLFEQKKTELAAHETQKPAVQPKPADSTSITPAQQELAKNLEEASNLREELKLKIEIAEKLVVANALLIASLDKVGGKIKNFETEFVSLKTEINPLLTGTDLNFDTLIKLIVDISSLEEKQKVLTEQKKAAEEQLDVAKEGSLAFQKKATEEIIKSSQDGLDEPNKKYQAYILALNTWEEKKKIIEGTSEKPDTVKFYETDLANLATIPALIISAEDKRTQKVKEIFAEKSNLSSIYQGLYKAVQDFIAIKPHTVEKFRLDFSVSIRETGFLNSFIENINQAAAGTFYGQQEGQNRLRDLLARSDFNNENGVLQFVNELLESLRKDKRNSNRPSQIAAQLKKSKNQTVAGLYDLIFSLDYLAPRYTLTIGDKEISQLSPGERGALLLVFYLLVDKDDVPLIIDQPEENLDNQTVFELLVPYIKQAKERRQVIMVTHNPNLAVVCDAEQIISCAIDKASRCKVTYLSGAIEAHVINKSVLDVLEGTRPAFNNREAKYLPQ